jgi:hypothetical protein
MILQKTDVISIYFTHNGHHITLEQPAIAVSGLAIKLSEFIKENFDGIKSFNMELSGDNSIRVSISVFDNFNYKVK